jgi:hypothetical protein
MTHRRRLPDRRASESFDVTCNGVNYTATVAYFDDGRLGEIFLSSHKSGSDTDIAARDAAVCCSLALQSGVPVSVIKHALLRDGDGRASSPLGAALDQIEESAL